MSKPKQLITVDGDAGGGQILRNGFSLAALAQQPLKLVNIRGSRDPPGLRPQHLQGIQMVADLCNGRLEGAQAGAMECVLWPSNFKDGQFMVNTGTAGSCTLLAQIALPCLLFTPGPSQFVGRGGTDVNWSPPIDEMCGVLMPLLAQFGADAQLNLVRRGFYPRGGGEVTINVERSLCNSGLRAIRLLDQGKLVQVKGRAFATGTEMHAMKGMVAGAKALLASFLPSVPVEIQEVLEHTVTGSGCALTLIAVTDTGCRYGATHFRGERETMAPEACGKKVVETLDRKSVV